MIPVVVEPAFAFRLEVCKVHDSSNGILRVSGNEEIRNVIVTVKVLAFATVLKQAMPSAEFDPTHNRETHEMTFQVNDRIVEQLSQLFPRCDRSVDWDHCPDRSFGRDNGPILRECFNCCPLYRFSFALSRWRSASRAVFLTKFSWIAFVKSTPV